MARGARRTLMSRALWLLYDAGVSLAVVGALIPLELVRIALGRARLRDLSERLGHQAPPRRSSGHRFLVHAVSAGEMAAAGALVEAIVERQRSATFVLSTGNRLGREAGRRLMRRVPVIDAVRFLPWDRRGAVSRWVRALAPDAVVVVETEIWPNLFRVCRSLGVPLFVVNGRLYPGDVARYRLARGFFAEVLGAADWIGTLDGTEREAFLGIGAPAERTEAVGNLKFDAVQATPDLPRPWRDALAGPGRPPLVVAGSTHGPEERLLFDALVVLRPRFGNLRLVVAPRHPRRCARLARLAESRGFATVLWSCHDAASSGWDVLLVDAVGALAAIFAYADVVFIGGSLVPHGGHNPIEAAAHGRPILIGPSTEHFRDIVRGMAEAEGLHVLAGTETTRQGLAGALAHLLADPGAREVMGRKASEYVAARRGVASRYATVLLTHLAAREASRPRSERPVEPRA